MSGTFLLAYIALVVLWIPLRRIARPHVSRLRDWLHDH